MATAVQKAVMQLVDMITSSKTKKKSKTKKRKRTLNEKMSQLEREHGRQVDSEIITPIKALEERIYTTLVDFHKEMIGGNDDDLSRSVLSMERLVTTIESGVPQTAPSAFKPVVPFIDAKIIKKLQDIQKRIETVCGGIEDETLGNHNRLMDALDGLEVRVGTLERQLPTSRLDAKAEEMIEHGQQDNPEIIRICEDVENNPEIIRICEDVENGLVSLIDDIKGQTVANRELVLKRLSALDDQVNLILPSLPALSVKIGKTIVPSTDGQLDTGSQDNGVA